MSIAEHLTELRRRLFVAVLAVVPGTVAGWVYAPQLLDALLEPLAGAFHRQRLAAAVHLANPADQIAAYAQVSLVAGMVCAMPVIAWQAWAFVAPGLHAPEKRNALPFTLAASGCFLMGATFGFKLVLPAVFDSVLALTGTIGTVTVRPTIMLGEYLALATRMLLAFGLVFQVPVVVVGAAALGLVTARKLIAFGRYWVVAASILAALLTPPDVGSQLLMLVPLVALYYASVGVAYFTEPKPADAVDIARGLADDRR